MPKVNKALENSPIFKELISDTHELMVLDSPACTPEYFEELVDFMESDKQAPEPPINVTPIQKTSYKLTDDINALPGDLTQYDSGIRANGTVWERFQVARRFCDLEQGSYYEQILRHNTLMSGYKLLQKGEGSERIVLVYEDTYTPRKPTKTKPTSTTKTQSKPEAKADPTEASSPKQSVTRRTTNNRKTKVKKTKTTIKKRKTSTKPTNK